MAGPQFDEEGAERWMQTRSTARRYEPEDPMGRFRNTSRSVFVDRKDYTGGALRGAVSDRRAEWMGGGAGGRMGEAWQNHNMIDVDRHGSGLDPFSYAIVKKMRGGVDKRRAKRSEGLNDRQWQARERQRSSARKITGMREGGGMVEEAAPEPETVEAKIEPPSWIPTAEDKAETNNWLDGVRGRLGAVAAGEAPAPKDDRLRQYNRTE